MLQKRSATAVIHYGIISSTIDPRGKSDKQSEALVWGDEPTVYSRSRGSCSRLGASHPVHNKRGVHSSKGIGRRIRGVWRGVIIGHCHFWDFSDRLYQRNGRRGGCCLLVAWVPESTHLERANPSRAISPLEVHWKWSTNKCQ